MEVTTIYLVEQQTAGGMFFGSYSKIVAAFLSREEADFETWKLEKEKGGFHRGISSYSISFSVVEVQVMPQHNNDKEYQKFIKEKLVAIESSIKERPECADKDTKKISELEEQKEYYTGKLAAKK
jgi:hypothetical protein